MSLEEFIEKGTFCPHPWISFYPSPRGDVFPCCVSMKYRAPGKVDPDMDIDKMINTDKFNAMRKKMMNGERPKECSDCWIREDSGVRSDRLAITERWTYQTKLDHAPGIRKRNEDLLRQALAKTQPDGSVKDFKIHYLEFRDNNICNYKCRFCNINSSNSWYGEWVGMGRDNSNAMPANVNVKTGVAESGVDWNKIDLSELENIHMAGGEPTAMDSTYWLLERLIKEDRAKHIEVGIVSNTSRLVFKKKNILDLLSHFKFVNWSVSADAMGDAHGYLRSGVDDWDKVRENINEVQKWANSSDKRRIKFHSTMSWSNAFQWWDMKREMDLDSNNPVNIEVYFSTGPDGHGLNDLPKEGLLRVKEFYKSKGNYKEVEQILRMCDKWMPKNDEENQKRWSKMSIYKEEMIWLDRSRNQMWVDVFPEWADFFKSIRLPLRIRQGAIQMQEGVQAQIADFPQKYF